MYVEHTVEIFREVRRVLREDGTLFLNLGDSYCNAGSCRNGEGLDGKRRGGATGPDGAIGYKHNDKRHALRASGIKHKDLVGIPWRVAFALQADGWWLRQDIVWHKPNPMPESVADRCTKAHEYIFLLTKSAKYFYDAEAVKEASVYPDDNRKARASQETYDNIMGEKALARNAINPANAQAYPCRNKRSVWTVATQPMNLWAETVHWVRMGRDAVSGGMRRIASQDCPVHGHQDCSGGEHEVGGPTRSDSTDGGLGSSHRPEPSSSSTHHDSLPLGNSLDCPGPECVPSAKHRNSGSRKTGRALATTQPCMPCGGIPGGTGGISVLPGFSVIQRNMPASNTLPDEMDAHSLDQTTSHIVHKSSLPVSPKCTCSYYQRRTKKTSHFATFPLELIRPCIRAGTSAKGCCPACGGPWVRVVGKVRTATRPGNNSKTFHGGRPRPSDTKGGNQGNDLTIGNRDPGRHVTESQTLGWLPGCECDGIDRRIVASPTGERAGDDPSLETGRAGMNRPRADNEGQRPITRYEQAQYAAQLKASPNRKAMADEAGEAFSHYIRTDDSGARPIPQILLDAWIERRWLTGVVIPDTSPLTPIPCLVLDPFGGSGTTGVVAAQERRDWLLMEINPQYCEMARKRLAAVETGVPVKEAMAGQGSLFPASDEGRETSVDERNDLWRNCNG